MLIDRYKILMFIISFIMIPMLGMAQSVKINSISEIIKKYPLLKKIDFGISVMDIKNAREIYQYHAEKNFIPASVLKLFYTLSAIETKGEEYRFKTGFFHTGQILPDGTLLGDLIIVGGGDPTLVSKRFFDKGTDAFFEMLSGKLKQKDITCIDGGIILALPPHHYPVHGSWQYQDIGNYYGGGSYPLNFIDNEYGIEFKLGKNAGDKTRIVKIKPSGLEFLNIANHVLTGKPGTGDNAYLYNIPYSVDVDAKGTLYSGSGYYTIKGALPFPPAVFLKFFGDYLEKNNIFYEFLDIASGFDPAAKPLFTLTSPTLSDICEVCNNYSINMYSEAIASLLCLRNNNPDFYLTEEEIKSFFSKYDLDFDNIQIVDGCGLSSDNKISPEQINRFLIMMIKKLGLKKVMKIIPQAGVEGYAKSLFPEKYHIYIKSGSISGVINFSGIARTSSGKYVVFSLMTNDVLDKDNKKVRKILLKIIEEIRRLY